MPWHCDPYQRVSVVLRGESLSIEYRDGKPDIRIEVSLGLLERDEPTDRVHRAKNDGEQVYEEITVFFLEHPNVVHQPVEE